MDKIQDSSYPATEEVVLQTRRIQRSDLISMLLRCFLVQGSWNFQSMLGMGFCFCATPIIKRLFDSPADRDSFLRRHLEFFNAHPYFASWCLGAIARLEEEAELQNWVDYRPITVFKERLIGPLGAIGDRLFWGGIKPAVAGIGVWLALSINWIALPIFITLYNLPHFYIRAKGLRLGYRKGFDIVSFLSMRRYQSWFSVIEIVGITAAGLCIVASIHWMQIKDDSYLISFMVSIPAAMFFLHYKKSINAALAFVTIIAVILGIFCR
jgi:mannose/fructose/N-acetylgalactosamine-specific phosphotransferase system component IID